MNRTSRPLLMATIASVVAVTGASALGVAASAAPAAPHHGATKHSLQSYFASSGSSYASLLQIGNTIQSAKSALTIVGCGSNATQAGSATPNLNLPALGSIGSVTTSTDSPNMSDGHVKTTSGSKTTNISLLGGAIQAQALVSTAWAEHFAKSAVGGSTKLVDLTVLGLPVDPTPKPNTKITLPGIGYLVLNVQRPSSHDGVLSEYVTGLALHITQALPKLPAGTELVLGHSVASVEKLDSHPLGGTADGDQVVVPGLLNSGQTFRQYLPCNGTKNKDRTQSGAGADLGTLLHTGGIQTTVRGLSSATPKAITSSTVAQVKLLNGLVTANVIRARAAVEKIKGKTGLSTSSDGSELLGLTIAGKTISTEQIKPNTKYSLAGIGTLWLDRTITGPRRIQVHMIELDLTSAFDGYAAGTVVTVADANAHISGN